MTVRSAVAAPVNNVFINVQASMAAGSLRYFLAAGETRCHSSQVHTGDTLRTCSRSTLSKADTCTTFGHDFVEASRAILSALF